MNRGAGLKNLDYALNIGAELWQEPDGSETMETVRALTPATWKSLDTGRYAGAEGNGG